jgi:hypothetical protein
MLRVVVLSGIPESRHTFKRICRDKLTSINYTVVNLSYLDLALSCANWCGLKEVETTKDKQFVADIQKALVTWNDAVLKDLIQDVDYYHYNGDQTVVFIDVLDFTEVEKVKKAFNASTLIVRRPQAEIDIYFTAADPAMYPTKWDYTIWHDGGTEQLEKEANDFIVSLLSCTDNIYRVD